MDCLWQSPGADPVENATEKNLPSGELSGIQLTPISNPEKENRFEHNVEFNSIGSYKLKTDIA